MKVNKRYLALRIITFPIKLLLNLIWFLALGIFTSIKWVLFGSQELYYGKNEGKDSLVRLIEQNEEIIKQLKND